jgi:hypothetical protein
MSPQSDNYSNPLRTLPRPVGWLAPIGATLIGAILAGVALAVVADQKDSLIAVSATVAPKLQLIAHVPTDITLSQADVLRGSAEIATPVRLEVSSNSPDGMEIDVSAPQGLFTSMRIQGRDLDATLPGGGGTIAYRWSGRTQRTDRSLDIRFTVALHRSVVPGTYAWPIVLNGRELQTVSRNQ